MTKTTIYLAQITRTSDVGNDMTLLQEAFNSFEKAQIVMASEGLIAVEDFNGLVWENPTDLDIRGDITPLTVK